MAATGKTPILLYGSTTATNTPSAGNLTNSSDGCEIAINVADKNLFFKDSTNTVNTVPIRQSSTSSNGWLSSTDWNTFNNKQPAGTYVTSVTGTAPVVSSGGTTPAISMAAATGSVNGYLTSTDWNTFNNKVSSQWSTVTNGINYAGNVGVNASPVAWNTWKAIQVSGYTALAGLTSYTILANNWYAAPADTYMASDYASQYLQHQGSHTFRGAVSGTAGAAITWTDLLTVAGGGDVTVNTGNLVIGTSGKGIDFSATAGTGTSELLADYEEGTWTPTVTAGAGSITSYTSSGTYTKIGNVVNLYCYFQITNKGTATGALNITGVPYSGTTNRNPGIAKEIAVWGYTGGVYFNSSTNLILYTYASGSPIETNVYWLINVSYEV